MKKKRNSLVLSCMLFLLVYTLISYYMFYPALDIHNPGLYLFLFPIIIVILFTFSAYSVTGYTFIDLLSGKTIKKTHFTKAWLVLPIMFIVGFFVLIINSPLFMAHKYYERIKVDTTHTFEEDIKEVDFNKLPLLDRDSSEKLGDRVMGEMSELVSQYDVSSKYTQINYNDDIFRVTPLEYNGWIKWLTNRDKGITGYIMVNSTTGKTKLVKLKKGLKYAPSALFNENVYRKIQFSYPTYNFDTFNFEIDNKGNPYWVASVVKYHGLGQRREVTGVVLFNPIDGKSKFYKVKDVPKWIDHVYDADIILEQVNDWGKYKNGFLNTFITQKEVVATTTGYNYLAFNDDIYLYTGITSVLSDESNIGFILTNMRTKQTNFYSVAGAEEYSAMDSAKGQVQQMHYTSTFPILINLAGRPTYLISLKDNAGLVKMYAFVDVVDYQKVTVTDASKGVLKAAEDYLNDLGDTSVASDSKEVTIHDLKEVTIDGNTYYYFMDQEDQKYKVSIKTNRDLLPFIKNGDTYTIKYSKKSDVINIKEIK